jgi:hypothetical protein
MAMDMRRRTARREEARRSEKLVREGERLFQLSPGGAPERPIVITSPSEVEVQARGMPCPACGAELRVEEHVAPTVDGVRLREARVTCATCGKRRSIWFRLRGAMLN